MPVVAVVYATFFFFSCGMWCALLPVHHKCTYSQSTKPRGSSGFILSLFFVITDKKKNLIELHGFCTQNVQNVHIMTEYVCFLCKSPL